MEKILQRFNTLKAERSNWNNSWQRIAELVNTKKANFTSSQTEGEFYNTKVFDTTAQTCVKNRASTIKSMLFGNYDFKLEPVKKYIDNDNIVKFFDEATSILKDNLRNPNSSFNKALSQAGEMDATFGTSVIYSDFTNNHLSFKCLDLRECYIDVDYTDNVDTLFREFSLSVRQAVQQFGLENLSVETQKDYRENNLDRKVLILNVIAPKQDLKQFDLELANDFTYLSVFVEEKEQHLIAKQGYYEKPFVVNREGQKVGEKYGRSPSFDCISLINQANCVIKDLMIIVNRQAEPPLGTFDDKQVLDLSAGAINRFQPLPTGNPVFNLINETGQPQILAEYIESIREKITKCYGIDRLLDFNSNGSQMTAREVNERAKIRNETLNDLFQEEIDNKYNPLLERAFNLLFRNGYFNFLLQDNIQEMQNILSSDEEIYKISYYNQIERDKNNQDNNELLNIWNSAGIIAQLTQDLSVFDNLNYDKTITAMKPLSYTNEIFRNENDVRNIREKRQEQQQQMMAQQMLLQNANQKQ